MSDEFYAKLVISSHTFTPDEINSKVGIKCDACHAIGDLRKNTIIREQDNAWLIRSRLGKNVPLEQHIQDLLSRLSSSIERIRSLADEPDVEVEFGCVVFTCKRPAMFFTRDQIAAICAMGASMDFDLYFLPEEVDSNKSQ